MKKAVWSAWVAVLIVVSAAWAQSPRAATYITDEQVKAINASPGVDRQIVSVDIGKLNEAVGIIHRGPTTAPARGAAPAGGGAAGGGGAPAGRGAAAAPAPQPCGEQMSTPPAGATPGGIAHDHQTETYIIVSGSGTLVTGGHIVNGRKSAPDSQVTLVLNGPSCSGMIAGDDVVKRVVKTGDIIIIPAGTPHSFSELDGPISYLVYRFEPSAKK